MHVGTWIYTKFFGSLIGKDIYGNQYYESKVVANFKRSKRWVCYNGIAEPTKIPSHWNSWLNHQTINLIEPTHHMWQLEVQPNLTGTDYAYLPKGHVLNKGKRDKVSADYIPWQPKI